MTGVSHRFLVEADNAKHSERQVFILSKVGGMKGRLEKLSKVASLDGTYATKLFFVIK